MRRNKTDRTDAKGLLEANRNEEINPVPVTTIEHKAIASLPQGAHNAATAGVASIEHGFAMTDEDLEIAKKNNVVLVGTEYLGLTDAKARPRWVDRLRRAYKIGVTMAYGTDVIDEVDGQTRGTLSISGIRDREQPTRRP